MEYFIKVLFFTRTLVSFFIALETGMHYTQGSPIKTQLFTGLTEQTAWQNQVS